jgi:hypothetical protein
MAKVRKYKRTDNTMAKVRKYKRTDNTMAKVRKYKRTDNTMAKVRKYKRTDNTMAKVIKYERTDNTMAKVRKYKRTNNDLQNITEKIKIEQYELHYKPWVNSGALEGSNVALQSGFKSDSTHHFFRNACTKSGSLRFSQFSDC